MRQSSPEQALTVAQVRELGRNATRRSAEGRVFEYERGVRSFSGGSAGS